MSDSRPGGAYAYNAGLLFEGVAAKHADEPALRFGPSDVVTYDELNGLANRIARWLSASGVSKNDVVGILSEKVPQAYACMIACLKLGAIYTTLDNQVAIQRLASKLSTCSPKILFVDAAVTPQVRAVCEERGVRILDASAAALDTQVQGFDDSNLGVTRAVTGEDPAYIMFTSGSTGSPKGAVITHANLINFRNWTVDRFGTSPSDVFTNVNPMYFDNSVFDFYASVFTGASMTPFSSETVRDARALVSRVDELGCTVWFSVPSLLIYLTTMKALAPETLRTIRTFVFGGEGYPKSELKKLFDLYGKRATFVNVYGPTECTCICSAYDVGPEDFENLQGLPPLGKIADNFSYRILDEDGHEAEPGEVGELCLLGPNVGKGYYGDPEQTRRSFGSDPCSDAYDARMYRTGDLVRYRAENGYLYFAGRKDNQIKHMGYRIELEEIEAALNSLQYVAESVALYRRTRPEFGQIIAVVGSPEDVDEHRIKKDLAPVIPDYMVPNRIVVEEDLPKNRNGKIDRKRLAALYSA